MPSLLLPLQKKEVTSQHQDLTPTNVTSLIARPEESSTAGKELRKELRKQDSKTTAIFLCSEK